MSPGVPFQRLMNRTTSGLLCSDNDAIALRGDRLPLLAKFAGGTEASVARRGYVPWSRRKLIAAGEIFLGECNERVRGRGVRTGDGSLPARAARGLLSDARIDAGRRGRGPRDDVARLAHA